MVYWGWVEHLIEDYLAEAVLVERVPANAEDQFPVKPAYELSLHGVLVPCTFQKVRTPPGREVTYYPDYDGQSNFHPDTKIDCLRVIKLRNEYFSLALVCVDEDRKVYERIGMLKFRRKGNSSYRPRDYRLRGGCAFRPKRLEKGSLLPWWEVCEGWEPNETTITLI